MAKGRMLKKVICTSKKLAELKSDSARLLYTWLLPHLDVEGRFSGDPNIIKGYVCPRLNHITKKKIEKYLQELAENKLIIVYRANNDVFLQFTEFHKHQSLRRDRESESDIPTPEDGEILYNSGSTPTEVKLSKDNINKDKHLDFIYLTEEEHKKLLKKLGKNRTADMIERLNNYIGSHGKKYKSHYFTILVWDKKDPDKKPIRKTKFFKAEDIDNSKLTSKKKAKKFIKEITQDLKRIEDKKKVFNG